MPSNANNVLTLPSHDVQRLVPLLSTTMGPAHHLPEHLAALAAKVYECVEAAPACVPDDIVTMNSRVRLLDLASDQEITCTLVFPQHADAALGRISVLAPLGASLFGAQVGTRILAHTPQGAHEFLIQGLIYQPEAAGCHDP
ncbi:MAG TPA: GreA/GreB family elongation factor [Nitrococcus sp.]|nr:GreA/GreB family elongation factor [Nitrococcus sp.]